MLFVRLVIENAVRHSFFDDLFVNLFDFGKRLVFIIRKLRRAPIQNQIVFCAGLG